MTNSTIKNCLSKWEMWFKIVGDSVLCIMNGVSFTVELDELRFITASGARAQHFIDEAVTTAYETRLNELEVINNVV